MNKSRLGTALLSTILLACAYLTIVKLPYIGLQDVPGSALLNNEITRWLIVIILPIIVGFMNRLIIRDHGWWLVISWFGGVILGIVTMAHYHHFGDDLSGLKPRLIDILYTLYTPIMVILISSCNMRYFRLALIMIALICIDSFARPQAVFGDPDLGMVPGSRTDKSESLYNVILYLVLSIEFCVGWFKALRLRKTPIS